MKSMLWILLLSWNFHAKADAGPCSDKSSANSICRCQISELHPTQLTVGLREVREKEQKLSELQSEGRLQKYIQKNPVPVVLAPQGEIYILDHHHLARALNEIGVDSALCQVEENLSSLSVGEFWTQMIHNNRVYLYDENDQGPLPVTDLPREVQEMRDDPYRSLAKAVQEAGGYNKTQELYAEFKWAHFFRSRIQIGTSDSDFDRAVQLGVQWAQRPDAQGLPGYHGPSPIHFTRSNSM